MKEIMRIAKAYDAVLPLFDAVMEECTKDSQFLKFVKLSKVSDFSDGFVVYQGHCTSGSSLRAYLKSYHLDCLPLRGTTQPSYHFCQQGSGPFTIAFAVTALH